jgi:NADP-dependent 3-hydroxy acid dehydrogenase YdfG
MAASPEQILAGRTAVVTGATRGIGRAVTRRLVDAGATVALVARSEAELARVAAEVGGVAVPGDVASIAGAAAVATAAAVALDAEPDILVNSAGAFGLAAIAETEPDDFLRHVAVNLCGPFYLTRAFLPAMLARRSGHVVNVGSVAGRVSMPGNGAYGASKFGLRGLHQVLTEEVRGTGVRATLIEPAATDTPLWDPLDPDSRADLPSRGMMLTPDDVARAILFAIAQPADVELTLMALRSAR